ncbi:unnamed protein product [Bemisia tabaci]|uniref:Transient receptor potential A5 n=1 Tax=Bemisia tabaci TaxID=7038 RepID=A0A9P0F1Z7_BEMTA|nr:transient receptor potential A5 [Bemisia tabaci]CAH0388511.1 unnamed protein product [Bemisia tabaci]
MSNKVGYQPVRTEDEEAALNSVVVTEGLQVPRPRTTMPQISVDSVQGRMDRRQQRLNTELLDASIKGLLPAVKRALDEGANVNTVCRDSGVSASHIAAHLGHTAILQHLLSAGAKPKSDFKGRHPIHLAAWRGHLSVLEILVKGDVDVKVEPPKCEDLQATSLDSWDHYHCSINQTMSAMQLGATALHVASQRAKCYCVKFLFKAGASTTARDARDLTPMDVVGELSGPEEREYCARDQWARVPLGDDSDDDAAPRLLRSTHHFVQSRGIPSDDEAARSYLSDSRSRRGSHIDLEDPPEETNDMMRNIINMFIMSGAQLDGETNEELETFLKSKKMTPLHTAVLKGNLSVVRILLENDFDATILNEDGLAPIHLAVQEGSLEVLKILLSGEGRRQRLINLKNAKGLTPLHMAVLQEWASGVSLLLEAGADLVVTTSHDANTVLHLAAQKGNAKLINELLTVVEAKAIIDAKNKTHHTALMISVISGDTDSVEALLNHNADTLVTLPSNVTVLHLATQQGSSAVLEFLLSQDEHKSKSLVNTRETITGTTPLHAAALRGYTDCVKCLLQHEADVYAKASDVPYFGGTALHLASRKGHASVVKALVEHDKNLVGCYNTNRWYPLHIAARFGHRNCVKEIIIGGGNLAEMVKDNEGTDRTAIEILLWCLPQPVKLVNQLLDSAITVNGYPLNHARCIVKLHYDILCPGTTGGRQMRVLTSILNAGDKPLKESALPHPLVETFLHFKWKKLCGIFLCFALVNTLFTVSLTARSMLLHLHRSPEAQKGFFAAAVADAVCQFFLFLTFPAIIVKELLHASQQEKYYWSDFESWLKWSVLALTALTLASSDLGWGYEEAQKHANSFAVLLAWIHLLVLLSRLPSWGLHVLMFFSVARNFIKVFCAFSILILGFTFAFLIQFEGSAPFTDFWASLMKVVVMSSEFDYGSMFEEDSRADPVVGRLIFILFIVLVAVVLMNLLVGLAVSDITVLEAQGKSERLSKQVDFLSLIEGFVFNEAILKFVPERLQKWIQRKIAVPSFLKVYPGRPLDESLPRPLKESVLETLRTTGSKNASVNDACTTRSYESESDLGEGSDDEDVKNLISEVMTELRDIKKQIEILKR